MGASEAVVENIGLRETKRRVLQRARRKFGLGRRFYLGRNEEVEEIGEKSED